MKIRNETSGETGTFIRYANATEMLVLVGEILVYWVAEYCVAI